MDELSKWTTKGLSHPNKHVKGSIYLCNSGVTHTFQAVCQLRQTHNWLVIGTNEHLSPIAQHNKARWHGMLADTNLAEGGHSLDNLNGIHLSLLDAITA
jgi:hypothetical protein